MVSLSTFRNKGYAYRCLYSAFLASKQSGVAVDYIVAYVPPLAAYEWVGRKLTTMGFAILNDVPQYIWGQMNMFTMQLELGRAGGCTSEFDNIIGYLTQKVGVD